MEVSNGSEKDPPPTKPAKQRYSRSRAPGAFPRTNARCRRSAGTTTKCGHGPRPVHQRARSSQPMDQLEFLVQVEAPHRVIAGQLSGEAGKKEQKTAEHDMTKQASAKVCIQHVFLFLLIFSACQLNLGSILLVCASPMEVEAFCHEGLARCSPILPFPFLNMPNRTVRRFHVYLSTPSIFFFWLSRGFLPPNQRESRDNAQR